MTFGGAKSLIRCSSSSSSLLASRRQPNAIRQACRIRHHSTHRRTSWPMAHSPAARCRTHIVAIALLSSLATASASLQLRPCRSSKYTRPISFCGSGEGLPPLNSSEVGMVRRGHSASFRSGRAGIRTKAWRGSFEPHALRIVSNLRSELAHLCRSLRLEPVSRL
jgi:hypothetical protein